MRLRTPRRLVHALLCSLLVVGAAGCGDSATLVEGDGTAPGVARTSAGGLREGELRVVQRDVTGTMLRAEVGSVGEAIHALGGDKPLTVADSANLVAMFAFVSGSNTKPGRASLLPVRFGETSFTLYALERSERGRLKRFGFGDTSGTTQYVVKMGTDKLDGRVEMYSAGRLVATYEAAEIATVLGANQEAGCLTQFLAALGGLATGIAGLLTGNPIIMGMSFMAVLYGLAELTAWFESPCGTTVGDWFEELWDDFASWWCSTVSVWPWCEEV